MPKAFITPFKDYVAPMPEVKGDWSGTIGGSALHDAPKPTPDTLQGHDTARIQDSPAPGATVKDTRLIGS